MMIRRLGFFGCGLLFCATGIIRADEFPQVTNNERDAEAVPMEPVSAAKTMVLAPGLKASVFAAEPDVQNPIDMAWDDRNRLWIAENYTYSDRQERFDLSLRDRVVVLSDTDGDGKADDRRVFVDSVQMLTSVEVGYGGVWLMCPPQLLFIPDADQDAVPDSNQTQVVLDGFTVAAENYHNFANGLRFGPDGWLYGRCGGSCPGRIGPPGTADEHRAALEGGMWRYHPRSGAYEVLTHGTTNPWGHDWNEHGEGFFINTVNGHFWHLIPGAHLTRPFTLDPNPHVYELIDMHADHWHFDTTGAWHESRDGVANEYGGGHAHCGAMIYLGDQWPREYRDSLLTVNLHGRRLNRELLSREGSGYVARHGEDTLISKDPFFRGMELSYDSDGVVYLIDWSDTGECHDHTGVHRTSGRVFRIEYEHPNGAGDAGQKEFRQFDLRRNSDSQLVVMQSLLNEWFVRRSRLILAERAAKGDIDPAAVTELRQLLTGSSPLLTLRALWTLNAMALCRQDELIGLLAHKDEHVRVWAVRLLTEHWPIDDCFRPLVNDPARVKWDDREDWVPAEIRSALIKLARSESSALVRLTLASTLQRLPVEERLALAGELVQQRADANDHNLPLLVWYGVSPVAEVDPEGLAALALQCEWPTTQRLVSRRLSERIDAVPNAINGLVEGLANADEQNRRHDFLQGMTEGLRGWRRAPKPAAWDDAVAKVAGQDAEVDQLIAELNVVFGDGRAMEAMRALVMDEAAEIGLRRSALTTLVDSRSEGLRAICERLLGDARLNVVAARGLAIESAPEVGKQLIDNYRRFRAPERPKVIAILCSRPAWAELLLEAIDRGKIARNDLTAFDARQLRSLGNESVNAALLRVWGNARESSDEKRTRIEELRATLTADVLAKADLLAGRALFKKTCQQCHRLYGQGEQVGPDLTGSNRNNLDYLLENMVDPSAVVGKDFRMTVFVLDDGRVLNGLVVERTERTIALQTQTERQVIETDTIVEEKVTELSPMPEQLLDSLSETQVRDLIGYLMHPSQVR